MFKTNLSIFLLMAGMFVQNVNADDLSSALQQTEDCLRNQNCDSAKTDAGKAADHKALEAVGGNAANKQALYNISADMMPILEQQAGGDPIKLQAILQKAQTDPDSFLNSLTPEIQTKIKNIANELEKNQMPGQRP